MMLPSDELERRHWLQVRDACAVGVGATVLAGVICLVVVAAGGPRCLVSVALFEGFCALLMAAGRSIARRHIRDFGEFR